MTKQELVANIIRKKSFLCVGLDPDLGKIPQHLLELEDPIFEFNKAIIDATSEFTVAYKPNLAFYESLGISGYKSFERTISYLKSNYTDQFIIADAKRGDIGNTSKMYANAFFNQLECDAITLSPYMGSDSIGPFLTFEGKWAIVLALTSNKGAFDFQYIEDSKGENLFSKVLKESSSWGTDENMMYVVGATKADMLKDIREIIPNHFLLVPGVGAQGGSLEEVVEYGITKDCGLLVNSSRGIIYAGSDTDYSDKVKKAAHELQSQMELLLVQKGIVS